MAEGTGTGIARGYPTPAMSPYAQSIFPAMYFLDSDAFIYGRHQVLQPNVKVPSDALAALGSSTDLRAMIEEYFATVHTYFAVISKIRLYQHLANPIHEPGGGKIIPLYEPDRFVASLLTSILFV